MWQRIQTVFLFLAAISSAAVALFSFKIEETFNNFINCLVSLSFFFYANVIVFLIAIITIFLFKKRKIQILLCNICIVFLLLFFVGIAFWHVYSKSFIIAKGEIFAVVFSVVSLIFIIFAKKYIKKDEKKVRSLERIR